MNNPMINLSGNSLRGRLELFNIDFKKLLNTNDWLANLLEFLMFAAIATVVTIVLLAIEKRIAAKYMKKRKSVRAKFAGNLVRVGIIGIAAIWVLTSSKATADFGKVLFQGTAILGAVVGLAAQPVISDLFCGIMISANKPFEIGDRIELDNGVKGDVTDITARHVVIRTVDTVDAIIPNSKLNACVITNMSHNTKIRSVHLQFNVAYGTDMEKAMAVIRQAVIDSEYTVPAWKNTSDYGPVYFMSFADSSLVLATTVYFQPTSPTEFVKSDINMRVNRGLAEAGIEIPFNHVSVVMKQPDEAGNLSENPDDNLIEISK